MQSQDFGIQHQPFNSLSPKPTKGSNKKRKKNKVERTTSPFFQNVFVASLPNGATVEFTLFCPLLTIPLVYCRHGPLSHSVLVYTPSTTAHHQSVPPIRYCTYRLGRPTMDEENSHNRASSGDMGLNGTDDLPKSLDDRRSDTLFRPETEMYDAWQGS